MGTSVRQVMEDTVLEDNWLLKKDCMIQMPSRVIRKDNAIWGSDGDEFNSRRFMKDEAQKTQDGRRQFDKNKSKKQIIKCRLRSS